MPKTTQDWNGKKYGLDARPDRLDIRDLPFRPPVINLPPIFPTDYRVFSEFAESGLIANQGNEGACTGFGLSAVINWLLWNNSKKHGKGFTQANKVSPRMLFHLARFYDEWENEDYEGSSCRGALKGWHRHGVCAEELWPYEDGKFIRPNVGWDTNAIQCTLGVYYRIQLDSIVDMQAAIYQAGAIYVSAKIHDGWGFPPDAKDSMLSGKLPIISKRNKFWGGHAFAITGYNEDGFIVQNSWGKEWGWRGFATLPYEDWLEHGTDAWTAALGVPVKRYNGESQNGIQQISPQYFVSESSRWRVEGKGINWLGRLFDPIQNRTGAWDRDKAYEHSLVTGNDGNIINRLAIAENSQDNIQIVAFEKTAEWFKNNKTNKPYHLLIYAHGGLASEGGAIQRIRILGPNFINNNIYPLFVTWRSGWLEVLGQMALDKAKELFGDLSLLSGEKAHAGSEAFDRFFEKFARVAAGGMWREMKENIARSSNEEGHGLHTLAIQLKSLRDALNGDLKIHLAGHSAGALVCGQLLTGLYQRNIHTETCTLFAPACDVIFANEHFGKAIEYNLLDRKHFHLHVLSDALERGDNTVWPYGKSLLYLVSRSLERLHKTPLLGLATVFDSE